MTTVAPDGTAATDTQQPDPLPPLAITIGGLKGGIGKTTSAVFLAAALAADGPTLAIDADPQSQSLYDWTQVAIGRGDPLPYDVIPWATNDLATKVRGLRDRYKHLIIDVGGETSAMFRQATCVAPELLIPCRPHPIELRRIPATLASAQEVQQLTGVEVYPRVLLVAVNPTAGDEAVAREFLATEGIPTMDSRVRVGVGYVRAFGHHPGPALGDYTSVLEELRTEVAG
ncbi:AAA family ATPase [Micromonospora haikouensis]|uniref:AAA family ATPase n=1 Tax=Micromonospora haikouensis TaxID=686309 RepID=UPI0033F0E38C